ncbi:response regulator, partial [bacterium]|nr:response regulator [bacterium]
MGVEKGTEIYQDLERIIKSASTAAELSKQMLAYSGGGKIVVQTLDICSIIREMNFILQSSLSKNVTLKFDCEEDVPAIRADEIQIRQVFMNLVINASEAIGTEQGVISIFVGYRNLDEDDLVVFQMIDDLQVGDYVYCEVTDTGSGISDEAMDKLFDPFFTTKITGRGLGLSAVQGIMRAHNGAITVESKQNEGTKFTLILPATDDKVVKKTKELGTYGDDIMIDGTIMVVDDEPGVREITKQMLEMLGMTVYTAEDGMKALEMYGDKREEIDVILLDMTMPNLNGEETFTRLYAMDAEVKVIIASGYAENDISDRFKGRAISGYCQKPFRIETLKEMVLSVLNKDEPE